MESDESAPLTQQACSKLYKTINRQTQTTEVVSQSPSTSVAKASDPHPFKKESTYSIFKGLVFASMSGVFYSSATVIVKYMTNMPPGQLCLYRFIAIFLMCLPETVHCGSNPFGPRDQRLFLILGGLFGATNIFLNFVAYRYLPLGEAAVIIFSVPVFVTVAARVFLKEPCGIFQGVTVFITIIGIGFTAHLPSRLSGNSIVYTKEKMYGVMAAVVSLLFSTCRFIAIRKVKAVNHAVIMFNLGWVAVVETAVITYLAIDFKWHACGIQSFYIVLLGVLSYGGQNLLTMALQCELTGPVSTMRAAADISMAFVWQIFLFKNIPDVFSVVGAVMVGFSVVFVGFSKWVSSLPDDSTAKRRLRWMLS